MDHWNGAIACANRVTAPHSAPRLMRPSSCLPARRICCRSITESRQRRIIRFWIRSLPGKVLLGLRGIGSCGRRCIAGPSQPNSEFLAMRRDPRPMQFRPISRHRPKTKSQPWMHSREDNQFRDFLKCSSAQSLCK